MRRLAYFVFAVMLLSSAVYVTLHLVAARDHLILAAVSPAIVAAVAYGATLLVRATRP